MKSYIIGVSIDAAPGFVKVSVARYYRWANKEMYHRNEYRTKDASRFERLIMRGSKIALLYANIDGEAEGDEIG